MANWHGSARSNYVRVKDREMFMDWAQSLPDVEVVEQEGAFALLAISEDGGWPSFRSRQDQEDQEDEAIDLAAEIADHLAPGEVCIFQQVGAEKLRYLSGSSLAVNGTGETLQISIDDIYTLVRERWNLDPREATY
jgi:hypothetical protein